MLLFSYCFVFVPCVNLRTIMMIINCNINKYQPWDLQILKIVFDPRYKIVKYEISLYYYNYNRGKPAKKTRFYYGNT